jgi:hypothetical protein
VARSCSSRLNHNAPRKQREARTAWCGVRRVLSDDVMHRATALAKHKVAGSTSVTRSQEVAEAKVAQVDRRATLEILTTLIIFAGLTDWMGELPPRTCARCASCPN